MYRIFWYIYNFKENFRLKKVRESISNAPLTVIFILVMVLIYFLEIIFGGFKFSKILSDATLKALIVLGSNAHDFVFNQKQYWRLSTAILLHGNLLHILLNCLSFWSLGNLAERKFGREMLFIVFLYTGLIASLTFALFGSRDSISIGSSGAICGMLGFLISIGCRNVKELFQQLKRNWKIFALLFIIGLHIPDFKAVLQGNGIILEILRILNRLAQFILPNVDNWAHGGGVLAGIVLGLIYPRFSRAIRINLGRLSAVLLLSSAAWIFKLAILG
jgi:rhomboid protease GluP